MCRKGCLFIPEDMQPKLTLVNRKPILPSEEELEVNNRSHSAKLRVARKGFVNNYDKINNRNEAISNALKRRIRKFSRN